MIEASKFARWLVVLLACAMFVACSTPPQKPPQPKPLASPERPSAGPPGTVSQGGAGAPGAGQGYGPASAHAAEVDEEEVNADGTTRLISSSRRAAAPAGASAQQAAGGTAGAPMSSSSSTSTGGSGALPAQPARADLPSLEGAHFDLPEEDLRAGGDSLDAAPTDGANDGRDDATAAARHGVRGGRDESGATRGTAPVPFLHEGEPQTPPANEYNTLAQQLREAAEQEKDPVLREKLWAEYHKYKAGL